MNKFGARWFFLGIVVAGWGATANAQATESAEELLLRSHGTLTALPHLEVTVSMRDLRAVEERAGREQRGHRLLGVSYQQLRVTRRQPDDWRIVSHREHEVNGMATPERRLVFAKLGSADATLVLLNAVTKEPARTQVPAALFRQEVLERAGASLRADPVLSALLFNREDAGAKAFALENVSRAGPDEAKGVKLTRLSARTGGGRVSVWIDDATGLPTRVLQVQGFGVGSMQHVTETLYSYDLSRGAEKADFDLDEGWALTGGGIAASAGFVPVAELLASTGMPGLEMPASPGLRREGLPSAPGSGAVVASTPASASQAPEEQLLTPRQMEAIVLVEGDDGAGSGFIARIRDVDFVVTNLHVIGGNEKVRVTTVRGVPVKVGAIFGAAGRDIALLRIEAGEAVPAALTIAEDPLKTAKLGDKVAVVGNRRGGGVATQVSGVVRGIGPDKVEVDAPFQPGNSGSPIVHVATGEVIGLATYTMTRRLDELDGAAGAAASRASGETATEQRWFGHRADGVGKWEVIDQAKWRAQAKRIADFNADSEAIYYAMHGRFKEASRHPKVRQLVDRLDERVNRLGSSQTVVMQEVEEFFRGLNALADSGTKELKSGDYYDYFRTSLYWETSIPEQLRAREDLRRRLDQASANSAAFLAKLRR